MRFRKGRSLWFGLALLVVCGLAVAVVVWFGRDRNQFPADVQRVLASATDYELLSLDPRHDAESFTRFHGYAVLGVTPVKDAATRAALNQALQRSLAEANTEEALACFEPRHGVRATRETRRAELVICFECERLHLHFEGRRYSLAITESPEADFDRLLQAAGVPLAPKMQ